jgi:putative oxygen-independent coproporphyrinogen III oxidase
MGLYVHWPFCLSKCPYCDFNSHVRASVDHGRWRAALLAELDYFAGLMRGRRLNSIFFGGGTPSLMPPETVAAIIERAALHWQFAPDIEITLEANPTSVEAGKFAGFRAAGVNRVSLGVQALDNASLKALGREHSGAEALSALKVAKAHFERVSFDLIYARPGQSMNDWKAELTRALDLAVGHLSLYQLTIEEGTAFANAYARGQLKMPGEDLAADLFDMTEEMMLAAGMPAYETSNHAVPGQESRHNLVYWRYQDYVGIGPGAHGRLSGLVEDPGVYLATAQWRKPEVWLEAVETKGHATETWERLDQKARAQEMLMMGLRLAEGISEDWFSARIGKPMNDFMSAPALAELMEAGFLARGGGRLAVTPQGRALLNTITGRLLS